MWVTADCLADVGGDHLGEQATLSKPRPRVASVQPGEPDARVEINAPAGGRRPVSIGDVEAHVVRVIPQHERVPPDLPFNLPFDLLVPAPAAHFFNDHPIGFQAFLARHAPDIAGAFPETD